MSARGPHTPLICSALLGALVISCGGPPADVAAPAPVPPQVAVLESGDVPAQERGLAEAAPLPAPAPRAALPPAPAGQPPPAAALRAPQFPPAQRRPAGVPVGVRAPDIPNDGDQLDKGQWDLQIADACKRADRDYGPRCLGVDYKFLDENGKRIGDPGPQDDEGLYGGLYYSCEINRTPDDDEYMELGAKILVVSTCYLPESSTSSTSDESGEPNQQTENNENAEDNTIERGNTNTPGQQSDDEQDETSTEDGSGE
jgi:hypothetical protein